MLRVIVRTDDAAMAANVGGNVLTSVKTIDIDAPQLEAYLREKLGTYSQRQVIAVELLENSP